MKKFSDLNIEVENASFIGDKIRIDRLFNVEITVLDFKLDDSKVKENTKCLTLQIEKNGNPHVVFTGSTFLTAMIQKVPKDAFPFTTTIVKTNDHFEFT